MESWRGGSLPSVKLHYVAPISGVPDERAPGSVQFAANIIGRVLKGESRRGVRGKGGGRGRAWKGKEKAGRRGKRGGGGVKEA